MGGDAITLPFGPLRSARLTLIGSGTGNWPAGERMKWFIADILDRATKGEIAVPVLRRPLAEVRLRVDRERGRAADRARGVRAPRRR